MSPRSRQSSLLQHTRRKKLSEASRGLAHQRLVENFNGEVGVDDDRQALSEEMAEGEVSICAIPPGEEEEEPRKPSFLSVNGDDDEDSQKVDEADELATQPDDEIDEDEEEEDISGSLLSQITVGTKISVYRPGDDAYHVSERALDR